MCVKMSLSISTFIYNVDVLVTILYLSVNPYSSFYRRKYILSSLNKSLKLHQRDK